LNICLEHTHTYTHTHTQEDLIVWPCNNSTNCCHLRRLREQR